MGAFARLLAGLVTRGTAAAARGGTRAMAAIKGTGRAGKGILGKTRKISRAVQKTRLWKSWGKGGKRRQALAARNFAMARKPAGGAPATIAQAQPPKALNLDYGRMMSDMGNPNAHSDEETRSAAEGNAARIKQQEAEAAQRLVQANKQLFAAVSSGAAAMYAVPKALKALSEAIVETRRRFAEYSGGTAAAFAQMDFRKLQLDIKTARGTTGTTQELAKAISEMRETWQPLDQLGSNLMNRIGVWAARGATFAGHVLEFLAEIPLLKDLAESIQDDLQDQRGPMGIEAIRFFRDGRGVDHNPRPMPPIR